MPPVPRPSWLRPDQLREWRRRLSLTQVQAASLVGISSRHYTYLEQGHTPISKAVALSCILLESLVVRFVTYTELSKAIDKLLE